MLKITKNKVSKLILSQLAIILAFIFLYFFFNSNLDNIMPSCFWKEHFNVICPSCGATRCLQNFFAGNFLVSLSYNPFVFVLIIYLILLDIVYVFNNVFNKHVFKFLYPKWWYVIIYFSIWAISTVIYNVLR